MITIIKGNLLDSKEKYIAHQCNAVSNQAGGLAYYLFKKFPYSDIYSGRGFPYKATGKEFPGHVVIKGNGQDKRFVINMIGQYYPGSPACDSNLLDSAKVREGYFWKCINEIAKIENLESIAFPFKIGCGLAAGDWNNYLRMINNFDIMVNQHQKMAVYIYNNLVA